MISIDLPDPLEKQFLSVITDCYGGDLQQAIVALLQLQKKYGWKEPLLSDVKSVREEVRDQTPLPRRRGNENFRG